MGKNSEQQGSRSSNGGEKKSPAPKKYRKNSIKLKTLIQKERQDTIDRGIQELFTIIHRVKSFGFPQQPQKPQQCHVPSSTNHVGYATGEFELTEQDWDNLIGSLYLAMGGD
ncbi:LOW QUALITY PROTEIN: hypothetical protein RvY_16058 [Ramazzottius varieornatus]|uniref:Uncharacterized protein n=1 Tax=Ramazzottius varieornatus TaxID=947166 RepID=A0A1D1VYI2_RAMVA|nr:LOW QUALITY PROTEIN: hypothetical protein RvY_16058 [Ramazzottius varieornatus]